MEFTYTQAKEIINELGRFEIKDYAHYGLAVIDTERGEYAIGSDDEADDAWNNRLDGYLEEVIYPELPDTLVPYFDDDSWKSDAKMDGRGHSLSSYDGYELDIANLAAFRIN